MAKNTGDNHRKGAVKNRSQVFNTKTELYMKRDSKTGKFVSGKESPYKGVSKENNAKKNIK
jgi:hypothetical protein